jgi:Tfp pilus assembly protein PilF
MLLFEGGRIEEAIRHFEKTVAVEPGHAAAWLQRAHAWKQLGPSKKAVAAYERAASFSPTIPRSIFTWAPRCAGCRTTRRRKRR